MADSFLFPTAKVIPFLGIVLLLSSCAPTPGLAPSGALKTQLHEIKQQQQQQANQLLKLQLRIEQLQQQLSGEKQIVSSTQNANEKTVQPIVKTIPVMAAPETSIPLNQNRETITIAASASSYLDAFSSLAANHLPAAEAGFLDFLQKFPGHQYSPNARFWLASAQLSQGKTNRAIDNFQQIINTPEAQSKAPAALVQLAQIYHQEGQPIQAENIIEQLRFRFPDSPEAQQFYRSHEPEN